MSKTSKQFQQLSDADIKDWKDALKKLVEYLKKALGDLAIQTIITTHNTLEYKTEIKIDGDVKNTFPTNYDKQIFDRHNAVVDDALKTRKEIILKLIEVIGGKIPSS